MFKRLRNSFLVMNCVIIGALIICCFGVNYLMVFQGVRSSVERRLNNEFEMVERRMNNNIRQRDISRDADTPPHGADASHDADTPPRGGDARPDFDRNQAFSPTFSVITDAEGNVTGINTVFTLNEDFYSERAAEIISSGTENGRFRYIDSGDSASLWRYKVKPSGDGFIIVFTEISSDMATLRMLAVCLLLIAIAATIGTVFISLFFANRSIKPIEEAYNKQKQFIADASHELKTPLATINTNIDVLLSKNESAADDDKKWLLYIKDEARRMSKLTNDLLYLARADHDDRTRVYSAVSWTDIVNNALLIMETRIFESEITLDSSIADGISVAASEEQLKQLVMILLDNAVKYTPSGGAIEVQLLRRTSDAFLTVYNTGAGIPAEDLPHIFDRFYRSDKARTYTENSGYGLGLAIAKAIAKSFRGTICAESNPDSGTLFTVKIPLLK